MINKKILRSLLLAVMVTAIFAMATPSDVKADTLIVVSTEPEPGQYTTIQDAIDAAVDGDTVEVDDGIYTGPGNKNLDFGGKSITVKSINGPSVTIIDCQVSGRGFYFHSYEDYSSVVEGFTIINGFANYGGGIYCQYSSPTITNNIITENTVGSSGRGGGIYCEYSSPTITNNIITENTVGSFGVGGGIYCLGSSPNIINNIITGNIIESYGFGGGISCYSGSSPTITNNIITENSAFFGGGIYCSGSSPNITYNNFWENDPNHINGCNGQYISDNKYDVNPLFVDPDNGDYHLTPDSPCIDAGNEFDPNLPETDFDGNPRIAGVTVDMGAFEYQPVSMCEDIVQDIEVVLVLDQDQDWEATISPLDIYIGPYNPDDPPILSIDITAFTCDEVGDNTVTLTVTEEGSGTTCEAIVTVVDETPPAPDVATLPAVTGECSATITTSPTATDNCAGSITGTTSDDLTYTAQGTYTVTWTFNDGNGNTLTQTQTIIVNDNVAPTAIAKNISVQLDPSGNASITAGDVDNGSSDACGIASKSVSPNAFTCANVGANPVALTVTDVNGNVSSADATVTVVDNVAPVVVTQDITVYLKDTGEASITAAQVDNGSSDACGIASLSVSPSSFTCPDVGAKTVTLTVTDNNGNISSANATVTVVDNVAPVAKAKDITVQLDVTGKTFITAEVVDDGSNDNCGIASLTIDKDAFDCSNLGPNTVTLTVTDNNGNSSTATATVTVEDKVAPTALAKDIKVQLDSNGNASITAADVDNGSNDNCGGIASISVSPSSFTCANVGANTVTLTVTDPSGNSSTATATVTVEDKIAPVIQSNAPATITPPDAPISFTATATDNCGASVEITAYDCYKITKKEKRIDKTESCMVSVNGDTITILDSGGVGTFITWTVIATDSSGNTTTSGPFTVEVVNPGKGKGKEKYPGYSEGRGKLGNHPGKSDPPGKKK